MSFARLIHNNLFSYMVIELLIYKKEVQQC